MLRNGRCQFRHGLVRPPGGLSPPDRPAIPARCSATVAPRHSSNASIPPHAATAPAGKDEPCPLHARQLHGEEWWRIAVQGFPDNSGKHGAFFCFISVCTLLTAPLGFAAGPDREDCILRRQLSRPFPIVKIGPDGHLVEGSEDRYALRTRRFSRQGQKSGRPSRPQRRMFHTNPPSTRLFNKLSG